MEEPIKLQYNVRQVRQHFLVTPEIAKFILEHHNDRNRPIKRNYVEQFKEDLRNGRFTEVGEIIISRSGTLMDGQHRLKAIVETGISAEMTIVFGQPDEDFDKIAGRGMTLNDIGVIYSRDIPDVKPKMFSAASIIMHMKKSNKPRGEQIQRYKLKEFIQGNLPTFQRMSKRKEMKVDYMYNKSLLYAIEFLLYEMEDDEGKKKVVEFFDNLWKMEIDSKHHSVEKAYVNWIKNKNHTGVVGELTTLKGTICAYDCFKSGKKLERLRVNDDYPIPDFMEKKEVPQNLSAF